MARPSSLVCRSCGTAAPADTPVQYCTECFGPLDLVVAAPAVTGDELRVQIESGPASMWRYADLLPFAMPPGADAVGWTPLVAAPALGERLGVPDLWLKDETANPTGSFKDRVVAAALARAVEQGATTVATASTGNLAVALAVAAPKAGLRSVILVPDDAAVGDAEVIRVRGGYDGVNRLATEAAMAFEDWAWPNVGLRPWYVEGSTSVAYEVAEQLAWRVPEHVVAPMASGALAVRLLRGFADARAVGLVPTGPRPALWVAQPAGCAPVAAAFAAGADTVAPVRPDTTVGSLAMGDPPDGDEVLRVAAGVLAVDEDEAQRMVELLAELEGIAVEPAGGVTLGALATLAADGRFEAGGPIVAVLTGAARTPAASGAGEGAGSIAPSLAALTEVLNQP